MNKATETAQEALNQAFFAFQKNPTGETRQAYETARAGLVAALNAKEGNMRRLTTEDGYRFTLQPDGTWLSSGGDMTIDNLQEFMEWVGIASYEAGEGEPTDDFDNADFAKEVYEFIYFNEAEDVNGRLQVIAANEDEAWQAFNEIGMLIYSGQWLMQFLGVQPCKR
jgi:hypothetical protein